MRFSFCEEAGEESLTLHVKEYSHIFRVRRVASGSKLDFANLKDGKIYTYKINNINKKEANLALLETKETEEASTCKLHIGWCMVEPKTIEKHLAMLNEMGVEKITFVYAEFSQKSYKIDEKRLKRILINSCEQSGRTTLMRTETLHSVQEYLENYPRSVIIDFGKNFLSGSEKITSFLVGSEGGFSQTERELFDKRDVFSLRNSHILRSETAVVGVCAKLTM